MRVMRRSPPRTGSLCSFRRAKKPLCFVIDGDDKFEDMECVSVLETVRGACGTSATLEKPDLLPRSAGWRARRGGVTSSWDISGGE